MLDPTTTAPYRFKPLILLLITTFLLPLIVPTLFAQTNSLPLPTAVSGLGIHDITLIPVTNSASLTLLSPLDGQLDVSTQPVTPLQVQAETTIVYLLTTTQSEYRVTVSNLDGSESETLYTVPFESKGALPTLFPQEEVDALNEYLTSLQSNVWRADVPLTEILVSGKINSISVSPNRRQVIVQASYERCLNPQHTICFGTTQLILIDRLNKSQQLLLNLGRHPNEYMSTYSEIFTNFVVRSIQWTLDQQAIVVGITDVETRLQIPRSAIVVVPIDDVVGEPLFRIKTGLYW